MEKLSLNKEKTFINKKKRKSNEEKKIQKIDMIQFKEKINQELKNLKPSLNDNFLKEKSTSYSIKYNNYINEDLSLLCLSFANKIIKESKVIPQIIKNKYKIYHNFCVILKKLMLNEFELCLFSLYLDVCKWPFNFSYEEYFIFLGLYIKEIASNEDFLDIFEYFKNNNVNFNYNYFSFKVQFETIEKFSFNDINKRYKFLKKSCNSYCKKDFIDYNFIVDKIIKIKRQLNGIISDEDEINFSSFKNPNLLNNNYLYNDIYNLTNLSNNDEL